MTQPNGIMKAAKKRREGKSKLMPGSDGNTAKDPPGFGANGSRHGGPTVSNLFTAPAALTDNDTGVINPAGMTVHIHAAPISPDVIRSAMDARIRKGK